MGNYYINNLLIDLTKEYLHIAKKKPNDFNRLISALLVIEKFNRPLIWRIAEYVACIYEVLFKKYITNYSIWKCQVKISMILDFYDLKYEMCGKRLYYSRTTKRQLFRILLKDRYLGVIKNALYRKFGNIDICNLEYNMLKNITLYYSRNNEFKGDLNYLIVIQHLYYHLYNKTQTIESSREMGINIYSPIETDRLILREFKKIDIKFAFQYLSDEDVCKYMVFEPLNFEQTSEYVKRFLKFQKDEQRRYYKFVIIKKDTNDLIGECGININDIGNFDGELVYRLNKQFWGYGYATEAVKRMINFGFNELKLHRIHAYCDIRNEGSIKVLEKAGLQIEGCFREHILVKGVWRSSYLYACLCCK